MQKKHLNLIKSGKTSNLIPKKPEKIITQDIKNIEKNLNNQREVELLLGNRSLKLQNHPFITALLMSYVIANIARPVNSKFVITRDSIKDEKYSELVNILQPYITKEIDKQVVIVDSKDIAPNAYGANFRFGRKDTPNNELHKPLSSSVGKVNVIGLHSDLISSDNGEITLMHEYGHFSDPIQKMMTSIASFADNEDETNFISSFRKEIMQYLYDNIKDSNGKVNDQNLVDFLNKNDESKNDQQIKGAIILYLLQITDNKISNQEAMISILELTNHIRTEAEYLEKDNIESPEIDKLLNISDDIYTIFKKHLKKEEYINLKNEHKKMLSKEPKTSFNEIKSIYGDSLYTIENTGTGSEYNAVKRICNRENDFSKCRESVLNKTRTPAEL